MTEFRKRARSSVARLCWQSALAAALLAAPHADAREIQTLPLGSYWCELPGDALTGIGRHMPQEDFAIVHSSTYAAGGRMGAYLMSKDVVEMTSGPHQGERYHRISDNFLRKLAPDGSDSELRCVRKFTNNRE